MDNFRGKSPLTSQLRNESELGSHQKSVHFFTLVSFENIKVLYSARTQKIRSSRGDTTYTPQLKLNGRGPCEPSMTSYYAYHS